MTNNLMSFAIMLQQRGWHMHVQIACWPDLVGLLYLNLSCIQSEASFIIFIILRLLFCSTYLMQYSIVKLSHLCVHAIKLTTQ